MTGDRDDDRRPRPGTSAEPAWHERTGTLAAASLAALVVLALLYFLISTFVREFDEPAPVQQYFLDPTTSGSARYDTTTTTSETITSTSPPVTTDINPGDTTSSSTDTSSTSPTRGRPPRTRDDDPTSTRQRPRLNETRTLYPRP